MTKLNLPESISKTSDSSKDNNVFGKHMGRLKKSKFPIIMGIILIWGSCQVLYWYSQGVRWVYSSGQEENPFIIYGTAVVCILLGLWFIIDYFRTPVFDIYENGLIIGKEEVLYNQIKEAVFIKGAAFKFIIDTDDKKIKYSSLYISKPSQQVLQQISILEKK
jgi:hypothetical protein